MIVRILVPHGRLDRDIGTYHVMVNVSVFRDDGRTGKRHEWGGFEVGGAVLTFVVKHICHGSSGIGDRIGILEHYVNASIRGLRADACGGWCHQEC